MKTIETDFAVVGSGLAGLMTAWHLAKHGEVLLFTKTRPEAGNSPRAQGGIAAAVGEGDSPELHREDTLRAGAGLCEREPVEVLVREGPAAVAELARLGVPFDRKGDGWALGKEGSHSVSRILHASGDATGAAITHSLLGQVEEHSRIHLLPDTRVKELVTEGDECFGLRGFIGKKPILCQARAVVMATGGCGQVYQYTTNDPVVTGDGLAMAHRAGAVLSDMEFLQFHPTALAVEQNPMFLISEAVRGEGAVLINDRGEAFMGRYHEWKDLAPRDVVSRAMDREMREGERVYLDARSLGETFADRFPRIHTGCRQYGIDPAQEPIPVTPAAHFLMGGIRTDSHGRTSLHRLFAVGEVACTGVHGANRLASNSLLEGTVFARRVADAAKSLPPLTEVPRIKLRPRLFINEQKGSSCTDRVRRIMWEHAGILRDEKGLIKGLDHLAALLRDVPPGDLDCHNMITVSQIILKSALLREESRGGHYRRDFPETREEWADKRIQIRRGKSVEPVTAQTHRT